MVDANDELCAYNYEKEFSQIISPNNNTFTNEQKYQLTQIKLLVEKRLQLENEYKRKYQEILNKYDKRFKPNYELRDKIITGEMLPDSTYPFYLKNNITPIQGTPSEKGIPGYWLKCIGNTGKCTRILSEEDEKVLENLINITCQIEEGADFTLTFTFASNWYFDHKELKVSYIYDKKTLTINEIKATDIKWKSEDRNPQVRRHIKRGDGKTTYNPVDSFFNIFKSIKEKQPKHEDEDEDEDEDSSIHQLHYLEELGCHIKDDLIPNSIEYYLDLHSYTKEGNYYRDYDPYDYYDEHEWNYLNGIDDDDY